MVNTIYRYNNDYDRSIIYDKIANIEEKIQEEQEKELSKERSEKVRDLMYAQLMEGLRLNTGYKYF